MSYTHITYNYLRLPRKDLISIVQIILLEVLYTHSSQKTLSTANTTGAGNSM